MKCRFTGVIDQSRSVGERPCASLLQEYDHVVLQLLLACDAYRQGMDALEGPLEKDVERAAQGCWQSREKSVQVRVAGCHNHHLLDLGEPWDSVPTVTCAQQLVQVKGGLFRTKTLIVEDPEFSHDGEEAFGVSLAQWQEAAEGMVAAAALELRLAEERLIHVAAAAE